MPAGDAGLPPWLVRGLAVVWTVGLINAFNMLDNMDLLSGGTAWVACACLALAALLGGPDPGPSLILLGALTGFLWFNRPTARIFMGDAGSTFLGFFLGLGSLQVVLASPEPAWRWVVPFMVWSSWSRVRSASVSWMRRANRWLKVRFPNRRSSRWSRSTCKRSWR